ncbi:beta-ribofuranosylaminobenzene 5'-phosphate synthase family protein [Streptomyces scabiei]|uniref:beta-ribofuranosylaminobenzene 5'-phosphate synthase family protein n=1 Tax=Streptomyces scabiei TaxID=1930 RepID=UPI00099D7C22|nr:beta-ribofuranosylaminobenzene 5'-phosphate synthase family protein [Streptomyces scabiei]
MPGSVLVTTPSRIAVCLIDMNGELGRVDGTLGIALDHPRVRVRVSAARKLEVVWPNSETDSLFDLAWRFIATLGGHRGALIEVEDSYQAHSGLGLTTQLRLAVIAGLARLLDRPLSIEDTGRTANRGGTSGAGVFAFHRGGVTLDGGHTFGAGKQKQEFTPSRTAQAQPPPLLARHPFPDAWRIICVTAEGVTGKNGKEEVGFFTRSCPVPSAEAAETCRIVIMRVLPAIVAQDLPAVNAGIDNLQQTGFKRRVWEMQDEVVVRIRMLMRSAGLNSVGLSSLGPTIYSVIEAGEAEAMVGTLRSLMTEKGVSARVWATAVNQTGASIRQV